jgi:hypothetical protein
MPDLFDPRLVFAKTPAGNSEIVERRLGLSLPARRVLILIDGRRSLAQLPALTRPDDLPALVAVLQSEGLISLNGIVEDLPPGYQGSVDPRLDEIKSRLRGAFERELGADARVLEARVQDCVNVMVMRGVLREVIDMVETRSGPASAQRIASTVRGLIDMP